MTFNRRTRTMLKRFSLLTHSLNVQLKQRRRNDAVITSTCVCSTKEMTKSLSDEKQGHPGKCHLWSWGQEKGKTAVPLSAKIFVKPPAPAYIHLLTLEDPFTVRQNSSSVMQTAPWIWRKQSSFALAGFVTISSLAGVIPPSVANVEAESHVTAKERCKHRSREQRHRMQGWGRKE